MNDETITRGSNNVFKDLGFEKPYLHQMKMDIVLAISRYAETLDNNVVTIDGIPVLTEEIYSKLSERLEVSVQELKDLTRGKFRDWSIESLTDLLDIIGYEYTVNVYKP